MNRKPQWLTPAEQEAWRSFIRMQERLGGRLSRSLQGEWKLSAADYKVLVNLTEAPDGRMRSVDLARSVEWEKSRTSHQISRMAKRGLVAREECAEDGRGAFAVITPAGRKAMAAAAPRHVQAVRRLFVDALAPEELHTVARLADRIVERLEADSS